MPTVRAPAAANSTAGDGLWPLPTHVSWRSAAFEQKVCGRGLKICQISSLFGPPGSLTSLFTLKVHHV